MTEVKASKAKPAATTVDVESKAKPRKSASTAKPAAKATADKPAAKAATANKTAAAKSPAKTATVKSAPVKPAAAKAEATKPAVAKPAGDMKKKAPARKKLVEKPSAPSAEERQRWIATAAYHRAEKRGFAPGYEMQDWFDAEAEIDALIGKA